jgi:hypothetical protein
VQVRLIYRFAVAVLSWLALLARSSASKNVGWSGFVIPTRRGCCSTGQAAVGLRCRWLASSGSWAGKIVASSEFREYENGVADVQASVVGANGVVRRNVMLSSRADNRRRQIDVLVEGSIFGLTDARLVVDCKRCGLILRSALRRRRRLADRQHPLLVTEAAVSLIPPAQQG